MGSIVNRIIRPDNYSIAVEFNEDALMRDDSIEIAMWCSGFQATEDSWMLPLTNSSMFFDPKWARYAGLNSIPNIQSSQYFNRYAEYPNCLIIEFDHEVEAGEFHLCSRFRLSPSGPIEEEHFSF